VTAFSRQCLGLRQSRNDLGLLNSRYVIWCTTASTINHCILYRWGKVSPVTMSVTWSFSSILIEWGGHTFNEQYLDASLRSVNCVRFATRCRRPLRWYPDYGNGVLISRPTHLVRRLQSVQNAVARLNFKLRRLDYITALVSLHQLHVSERVVYYKIAVLTFKVLHGITPEYLAPICCVVDLPGRQALRSDGTNHLVVPPIKLWTIDTRAFPVADPHVWNCLRADITSAPSLPTFR